MKLKNLLLIALLSLSACAQSDSQAPVESATELKPNPVHTCNLKDLGISDGDDKETILEKIKNHISIETTGATCGLITAIIAALVYKLELATIKSIFN